MNNFWQKITFIGLNNNRIFFFDIITIIRDLSIS